MIADLINISNKILLCEHIHAKVAGRYDKLHIIVDIATLIKEISEYNIINSNIYTKYKEAGEILLKVSRYSDFSDSVLDKSESIIYMEPNQVGFDFYDDSEIKTIEESRYNNLKSIYNNLKSAYKDVRI